MSSITRGHITDIRSHTFPFQFYHHVDIQKVLKGGPWNFDKHLLILSIIKEG